MVVTTASACLIGINDLTVGAGTTTGDGTFTTGDPVTIVATVKTGFVFVNWTVAGSQVSTDATYNFNAPAGDTTYVANFTQEVVVYTTTGSLGIEVDLNLDGIDIASYQKIQPSAGSLGIEVDLNLDATFDASVYQGVKLTSGSLGIEVDLNLDDWQITMPKQIQRTRYTDPFPLYNRIFNSTLLHNSFDYTINVRNAFGSFKFTTDAATIYVRINPTFLTFKNIDIFIDNVYNQSIASAVAGEYKSVTLPAGTKTVEIIEGITNRDNDGSMITGTTIVDVLTPKSSTTTVITETTTAKKIVTICDSAGVGQGVTDPIQNAFIRLFKINDSIEVETIGAGWDSIYKDVAGTSELVTATITRLTKAFSNATDKRLLIEASHNDAGLYGITSTVLSTYYNNLLDAVHALDSNIKIYCIGPFTGPSFAETLKGTYRTAIQGICTARSGYCTYINGPTASPNYPSNYPDTLHPNDAENIVIYNNIRSLFI
jgi:uncharacterized repeat protein (TIGR02543 family)